MRGDTFIYPGISSGDLNGVCQEKHCAREWQLANGSRTNFRGTCDIGTSTLLTLQLSQLSETTGTPGLQLEDTLYIKHEGLNSSGPGIQVTPEDLGCARHLIIIIIIIIIIILILIIIIIMIITIMTMTMTYTCYICIYIYIYICLILYIFINILICMCIYIYIYIYSGAPLGGDARAPALPAGGRGAVYNNNHVNYH